MQALADQNVTGWPGLGKDQRSGIGAVLAATSTRDTGEAA